MLISDLSTGQYFRFPGDQLVWEYRGSGWYASPGGYDGGPWHAPADNRVELYECSGCGQNDCPGCNGGPWHAPWN